MSCSAGDTQPTPRKRVYGLKLPTPISSGQKRKLPGLRQEMNADFAAGDSGRPRSKRLGKRRRDESDIAPNVMRSIDCNGRTKKARTAGKSKREAAVQLDVKMNEPAIAKGTQRKAKKATKVKIAAQKKIVKHSAQTGDKSDANKAPVADICPVRATGRRDDSIYSQMLTTLTQKTDGIDNKIEQVYRSCVLEMMSLREGLLTVKKDVALVDSRTARDLKEIRWTTLVEVLREEITHLKQHNEDLILREEARQTIFDDFKNERLELKRERKLWVQEPDGTLERERNELKKKRELLMERERKMLERERQLAALQAKMEKERTPWHELVMSYCPLFLRRFLQEQTPSSSLSPLSSSD